MRSTCPLCQCKSSLSPSSLYSTTILPLAPTRVGMSDQLPRVASRGLTGLNSWSEIFSRRNVGSAHALHVACEHAPDSPKAALWQGVRWVDLQVANRIVELTRVGVQLVEDGGFFHTNRHILDDDAATQIMASLQLEALQVAVAQAHRSIQRCSWAVMRENMRESTWSLSVWPSA